MAYVLDADFIDGNIAGVAASLHVGNGLCARFGHVSVLGITHTGAFGFPQRNCSDAAGRAIEACTQALE